MRRQFTDGHGVEWHVYDGLTTTSSAGTLLTGRSDVLRAPRTWLAFDSAIERRRLEPAPRGWQDAPDEELRRLLGLATVILKRPGPPRKPNADA